MKQFILVIITILVQLACVFGQDSDFNRSNNFKITVGRYFSSIGDYRNFYGAVAYTRKLSAWEIGLQGGFRYKATGAYGALNDQQPNVIGRSDGFMTNYPFDPSLFISTDFGNIKPVFREGRYFQTFVHLLVERNFRLFDHLYASVSLGPSMEYADNVFPAQKQDARVTGFYGKDIRIYMYDYLLHRYIAFGWMAAGRLKYDFGNYAVAVGAEVANYPKGNRLYSGFGEFIFKF